MSQASWNAIPGFKLDDIQSYVALAACVGTCIVSSKYRKYGRFQDIFVGIRPRILFSGRKSIYGYYRANELSARILEGGLSNGSRGQPNETGKNSGEGEKPVSCACHVSRPCRGLGAGSKLSAYRNQCLLNVAHGILVPQYTRLEQHGIVLSPKGLESIQVSVNDIAGNYANKKPHIPSIPAECRRNVYSTVSTRTES